ncbi:MAG: glycosyltransferase family 9 protein, partial [Acetobacteraceae bacterium]
PSEPYVSVDPALAEAWSDRLPRQGFRVGIVWAGQARPWLPGFASVDRRRGVGFHDLAGLADIPGVVPVSLQMGASCADGHGVHDPMPAVRDFADTAAIIANLDLVVSVDTSVVHLAAAMGKRVFLLDRYDNCWRWLHGRTDSPWYPSLMIFRQDRPLDWSEPLERMRATVAGLAAFNAPAATPGHPCHPPQLVDAA